MKPSPKVLALHNRLMRMSAMMSTDPGAQDTVEDQDELEDKSDELAPESDMDESEEALPEVQMISDEGDDIAGNEEIPNAPHPGAVDRSIAGNIPAQAKQPLKHQAPSDPASKEAIHQVMVRELHGTHPGSLREKVKSRVKEVHK